MFVATLHPYTVGKSSQPHNLAAAILSYFKVHRPPRLLKPNPTEEIPFQIIHAHREGNGGGGRADGRKNSGGRRWRAIQNNSPEREGNWLQGDVVDMFCFTELPK